MTPVKGERAILKLYLNKEYLNFDSPTSAAPNTGVRKVPEKTKF